MRATPLRLALLLALAACDRGEVTDPPAELSVDAQLRATLSQWGAIPIAPIVAQDPALVELGRALFFDKVLSGNRDVACATCHDPTRGLGDGRSLAVGTGAHAGIAARTLGDGRQFTPRNAPALFNAALGNFYLFWDGKVNEEGGLARFKTPAGTQLPTGLASLVAAQAMIPVTNRVEMRGNAGDVDAAGTPNELAAIKNDDFRAIWDGVMKRVLAIPGYREKFAAAFPNVTFSALGFQHAANAIAAFEAQAFTKTNSPFDRYLARQDGALTAEQKQGALLFFGRARCSSCHSGALLGGQQFANVGAPQLGPGSGRVAPLDAGRDDFVPANQVAPFIFRVPPLRNVELTAPYTHAGAYSTLEAVVRHYNDAEKALRTYDVSQLDPSLRASYHGDATTINALLQTLDFRLRGPLNLTEEEQKQLVAFLKSLTDPAARDLSAIIPASVPSGLPVR